MLRFAPYAALFALTLAGTAAQAQEPTQPGSQLKFHQTEQRYFPPQAQAAPTVLAPAGTAQPAPVMAPPPMVSAQPPAQPAPTAAPPQPMAYGEPVATHNGWTYTPVQPEQPEISYVDGRQLVAELQACESLDEQSKRTYCEMRARKDAADEADYQRRHMAPLTHYDRLAN